MFRNIQELRMRLPRDQHGAPWHLWLDKHSYKWAEDFDEVYDREMQRRFPAGKTSALILTCDLASPQKLYESCKNKLDFIERLKKFHGDRLRIVELVNSSKLMIHLGRASVLENVGLYAERITGLPVIPGTSLKGTLSTWATWEANRANLYNGLTLKKNRGELNNLAKQIFGDNSENGSEQSGEIVFVGGFPTTPPTLGIDVVNPHFDENGKDKKDLTPNTFLCIEPGTIWKFVFFARAGAPDYKTLLNHTETWLKECLTTTGIGAKIAAGYGRFREPTDKDRQKMKENLGRVTEPSNTTSGDKSKITPPPPPPPPVNLSSDYENEQMFRNRVINNLERAKLDNLKPEIEKLKKPENADWLAKFKEILSKKEYKEIRKKLKEKGWFPEEWLP